MVARQCPMRPRCAHTNGVAENSASLTRRRLYAGAVVCQRRRSAAHLHRLLCPRRCRGLTESVTARAVRLCHCCARRSSTLARSGWRRCSGAGMASVEDEVRRADPLSVNPGQRPGREDEEICTAGRCRCRCSAGVFQRRRVCDASASAAVPPTLSGVN